MVPYFVCFKVQADLRPGVYDIVPYFTVHSTLALQFPATSPLPPNSLHRDSSPSTPLPGGRAFFNPILSSSGKGKQRAREPERKTAQVVDVPLRKATYADVVGVDNGERPFVLFFCFSWFQKREKKVQPLPVYDDQLEDENVLDAVALPPPGVQQGEIDLRTMASQSQPEAGLFGPVT
ncbi:hypothetical protein EV424DRAFT_121105 [Suillus variegatus]|nr:hypothetical protein EV424DRAFT_121105 [Suillus variegatus]